MKFRMSVCAAALVAAALATPGIAHAGPVTYLTSSDQSTVTFTDVQGSNVETLTVTFTGVGPTQLSGSGPFDGELGTFSWSSDNGTNQNNAPVTKNFDLKVSQTAPTMDNNFFDGTLTGTILKATDTVSVAFSNNTFTLGNINYQLETKSGSTYTLLANNTAVSLAASGTTLYARITDLGSAQTVAAPEPSTLISGGIAGLFGLGYGWRRRKANVVA